MALKNNCIVIGGSGFIGNHLARKLLNQYYPVTIFSRSDSQQNTNLSDIISKISYIKGDIIDSKLLGSIITSDSYIFDLATSSVPASSSAQTFDEIQSHVNLIQFCCQKKVKKIIFASSGGGVYGHKKVMPISEFQHLQPSSPHAIGKCTIEYFLDYYCTQKQIPFVIYRISNPYGPGQTPKTGFGLIPTLFANVLSGTPPTLYDKGQAVRDFIYIDDLIEAITISFSKNNKYNFYNIGSGIGTKIINIWSAIKTITDSKLEPQLLPKRIFDVKKSILDIKRFNQEYNWKPNTKLHKGLNQTWDWVHSKN